MNTLRHISRAGISLFSFLVLVPMFVFFFLSLPTLIRCLFRFTFPVLMLVSVFFLPRMVRFLLTFFFSIGSVFNLNNSLINHIFVALLHLYRRGLQSKLLQLFQLGHFAALCCRRYITSLKISFAKVGVEFTLVQSVITNADCGVLGNLTRHFATLTLCSV